MSVCSFEDLLDKDDQMNILGWDKVYHQAIHFPEQVLQAYRMSPEVQNTIENKTKISIWQANGENDLLIQLLSIIFMDKLKINAINKLPADWLNSKGLLFIPDFFQQTKLINGDNVVYLTAKSKNSSFPDNRYINFQISTNEGLGLFLGFICRYIDDAFGYDSNATINKIVAADMQKAGVLAWRLPLKNNFAKSWAIRISQVNSCLMYSSHSEYSIICQYWQNKLQNWAALLPGKDKEIHLEKMMAAIPDKPAEAEIIFADGNNLLSQLVSLHYLANAVAIYTAIIKQVKYKKD